MLSVPAVPARVGQLCVLRLCVGQLCVLRLLALHALLDGLENVGIDGLPDRVSRGLDPVFAALGRDSIDTVICLEIVPIFDLA